jgi:hypothetical protein
MIWSKLATSWKMLTFTPHGRRMPETLDLPEEPDRLVRVGPSFNGWVYRSLDRLRWYRLVPVSQMPLARRNAVNRWRQRSPSAAFAPILNLYRCSKPLDEFFVVQYRVAAPMRAFSDLLHEPEAMPRVEAACGLLDAFAVWRREHPDAAMQPLFCVPSDMLCASGSPMLLALPARRKRIGPQIAFDEPELATYLAPEFVRGCDADPQAVDLFALGASLLQLMLTPRALTDPDAVLVRAAGARNFDDGAGSNLPPWMDRIGVVAKATGALRELMSVTVGARLAADSKSLGQTLLELQRMSDPYMAAVALRLSGRALDGFTVLLDVIRIRPSYDALVLAGLIAGQDLDRTIEALDLLERAIEMDNSRVDAYAVQFDLIVGCAQSSALALLIERDAMAGFQIDANVYRDFQHLSSEKQYANTLALAMYIRWRERFDYLIDFVYPRLFGENRAFKWWEFDLLLLYAQALWKLKRVSDATATLGGIKQGLAEAWRRKTFSEIELHHWRDKLDVLEKQMAGWPEVSRVTQ